MGPKKCRRMREIEIAIGTPTELSWGTQWQIYSGVWRRGRKEKWTKRHRNKKEGSKEGGNYTLTIGGSGLKSMQGQRAVAQ